MEFFNKNFHSERTLGIRIKNVWNNISDKPVRRPFIKYLQRYYPSNKKLIGCEIGTARGFNAYSMLFFLNLKKLYLVDPYGKYIDGDGKEWDYSQYKDEMLYRLRRYSSRFEFIQKYSVDAPHQFEDGFLDFVYIDGSHTEKDCLDDLNAWYPKVKLGGIISGHDFCGSYLGVVKAVIRFVDQHDLRIDGEATDWWIIKEQKTESNTISI